jgi:ribonuclease VapC
LILDTSAVVAMLLGEPDAKVYAEAINSATDVRISASTLVESFIVANAANAAVGLRDLLRASAVEVAPFTLRQAELASAAYRHFGRGSGHAARLNFGDTFAYALAMDLDEPLLFKGDDFSKTDVRPAI